jgi:hypothetical protein
MTRICFYMALWFPSFRSRWSTDFKYRRTTLSTGSQCFLPCTERHIWSVRRYLGFTQTMYSTGRHRCCSVCLLSPGRHS